VADAAAAVLDRTGAAGVAAAAAMAAALLAGVLGVPVAVRAGTAGVAGVSTEAAFRVLPVPAHEYVYFKKKTSHQKIFVWRVIGAVQTATLC
jgi:hypothetical protein